jgi:hypothetical protein
MKTLSYYNDHIGDSLTVWFGDPNAEVECEETPEEIVLMKDADGATIGMEILHLSRRSADVLRTIFDPSTDPAAVGGRSS